jgi:hypothetical protein
MKWSELRWASLRWIGYPPYREAVVTGDSQSHYTVCHRITAEVFDIHYHPTPDGGEYDLDALFDPVCKGLTFEQAVSIVQRIHLTGSHIEGQLEKVVSLNAIRPDKMNGVKQYA